MGFRKQKIGEEKAQKSFEILFWFGRSSIHNDIRGSIRRNILIRPGRQVLWPRAPLCLGPQELIWLLVLVLLLLLLLFLLQV